MLVPGPRLNASFDGVVEGNGDVTEVHEVCRCRLLLAFPLQKRSISLSLGWAKFVHQFTLLTSEAATLKAP